MTKGVTYLEPGYVFAPFVPLQVGPMIGSIIPVWFDASPQPGDLLMFHWTATDINGLVTHGQDGALCTRAWVGGDEAEYGQCLYESGFLAEFYKEKGDSWLEVVATGRV